MKNIKLCFLHGLDSSPQGTKARLLRAHEPTIWIPELSADILKRQEIVEKGIGEPVVVVGSSLGGLTAIMFSMKHPALVKGLVLMAPAVGIRDRSLLADLEPGFLETLHIPEGIPTIIIAGLRDELVPIPAIQAVIDRSPAPETIQLHAVNDDHNLHGSLDLMIESIQKIRKMVSEPPTA